ncbi:suppressor of cytokine signaling 7 [Clonorchis sinensis]|nr:suppressor of cytokine signaling 7 [Clonorchis sinensis]
MPRENPACKCNRPHKLPHLLTETSPTEISVFCTTTATASVTSGTTTDDTGIESAASLGASPTLPCSSKLIQHADIKRPPWNPEQPPPIPPKANRRVLNRRISPDRSSICSRFCEGPRFLSSPRQFSPTAAATNSPPATQLHPSRRDDCPTIVNVQPKSVSAQNYSIPPNTASRSLRFNRRCLHPTSESSQPSGIAPFRSSDECVHNTNHPNSRRVDSSGYSVAVGDLRHFTPSSHPTSYAHLPVTDGLVESGTIRPPCVCQLNRHVHTKALPPIPTHDRHRTIRSLNTSSSDPRRDQWVDPCSGYGPTTNRYDDGTQNLASKLGCGGLLWISSSFVRLFRYSTSRGKLLEIKRKRLFSRSSAQRNTTTEATTPSSGDRWQSAPLAREGEREVVSANTLSEHLNKLISTNTVTCGAAIWDRQSRTPCPVELLDNVNTSSHSSPLSTNATAVHSPPSNKHVLPSPTPISIDPDIFSALAQCPCCSSKYDQSKLTSVHSVSQSGRTHPLPPSRTTETPSRHSLSLIRPHCCACPSDPHKPCSCVQSLQFIPNNMSQAHTSDSHPTSASQFHSRRCVTPSNQRLSGIDPSLSDRPHRKENRIRRPLTDHRHSKATHKKTSERLSSSSLTSSDADHPDELPGVGLPSSSSKVTATSDHLHCIGSSLPTGLANSELTSGTETVQPCPSCIFADLSLPRRSPGRSSLRTAGPVDGTVMIPTAFDFEPSQQQKTVCFVDPQHQIHHHVHHIHHVHHVHHHHHHHQQQQLDRPSESATLQHAGSTTSPRTLCCDRCFLDGTPVSCCSLEAGVWRTSTASSCLTTRLTTHQASSQLCSLRESPSCLTSNQFPLDSTDSCRAICSSSAALCSDVAVSTAGRSADQVGRTANLTDSTRSRSTPSTVRTNGTCATQAYPPVSHSTAASALTSPSSSVCRSPRTASSPPSTPVTASSAAVDVQAGRLSFQRSMLELRKVGWYWGPLSFREAQVLLAKRPDGTFLVRDSGHDTYILSLSFRVRGETYHTRIGHSQGRFSFWSQPQSHSASTMVEFIEKAVDHSISGQFHYFLQNIAQGQPPVEVPLLYPLSRFQVVPSLRHLARFTILSFVRRDHIDKLPLPSRVLTYLKEKQYYVESLEAFEEAIRDRSPLEFRPRSADVASNVGRSNSDRLANNLSETATADAAGPHPPPATS